MCTTHLSCLLTFTASALVDFVERHRLDRVEDGVSHQVDGALDDPAKARPGCRTPLGCRRSRRRLSRRSAGDGGRSVSLGPVDLPAGTVDCELVLITNRHCMFLE